MSNNWHLKKTQDRRFNVPKLPNKNLSRNPKWVYFFRNSFFYPIDRALEPERRKLYDFSIYYLHHLFDYNGIKCTKK